MNSTPALPAGRERYRAVVSEISRWFVKGLYSMDHVVRLVPEAGWEGASPCAGWTGRHVLGHVVAMQWYYVSCIERRAPAMDPMTDPDRHVGEDPVAAWAAARDAVLEAIDRPGVLDTVVAAVNGEQRVEDLISVNVLDTTVHSWDLARAACVDDRLDPGLTSRCRELVARIGGDDLNREHYAEPVSGSRAGEQAALLAAVGRRG